MGKSKKTIIRLVYKNLQRNRVFKSFKNSIEGILWGVGGGALLSFVVWLFAYFGYTDLGLPQRFEYEKLDYTIREHLPANYNYTIEKAYFRNQETESLVVVARSKNAYNITNNSKAGADNILILDKTERSYKVVYKFEPLVSDAAFNGYHLHAAFVAVNDIGGDKKDDVIIAWSHLGANFQPPYIMIVTSDSSNKIRLLSAPKLSSYSYPKGYKFEKITNRYNKTEFFASDQAFRYYVDQGELVVVNRDDDACSACSAEHVYNLNRFSLYEDKLIEVHSPILGIKGHKSLEKYIDSGSQ